jgi:hypothetical protein
MDQLGRDVRLVPKADILCINQKPRSITSSALRALADHRLFPIAAGPAVSF